ncbi:cupin domain-containing protein [Bradyrhizobium sp. AUGA SZCCT0283]|uniref:AraC family transcriptional regulator n=1 Tax=Bradyrhizobium sp. AUGA SZCCT0283 TaxID=2807671 RepID=UPI001BA771FC|nr:cupin domain-containing protein [Bradyrhizobium sp. AUGA SZCCT0283]MBR1279550.1 cupin domain-containing protein [Bradyrhizobium sp. AUGA SZCCT0283]
MPDPLSDVLRSVRLTGGVFFEANLTAPWSVAAQVGLKECLPFLPDLVQVIGYHVVLEGRMLVGLDGEPPIELRAGEIVLFPRNDIHTMASAAGVIPVSAADLIQQSPEGGVMKIRYGGGHEPTSIICGFLGTQDDFNPLLATLPRMLRLDISKAASRDWVETSVRFAAAELARGRLASSEVMSRLSEVLLVEAVREYISKLGDREQGWLKGLSDPNIGRALALIHGDIAAPWSADILAKEVALSRSAFMDRFAQLIGMPPIRYLTVWRLEIAKRHLRESRMSVPQIAVAVGYESEEGFRRAFRREFEMWPAEWRDHQASA